MQKLKIVSIKKREKLETVYDINVKNHHHYFLDNGVISHNSFIPTDVVGGGEGSLFSSSIIVKFTKAQEKQADGRVIGARVTATTMKCRFAKEKSKIQFIINFDKGINYYSGLLDWCIEREIFAADKMDKDELKAIKDKAKAEGKKPPKPKMIRVVGTDFVFDRTKLNKETWDEAIEKGGILEKVKDYFIYKNINDEGVLDVGDDDEGLEDVEE